MNLKHGFPILGLAKAAENPMQLLEPYAAVAERAGIALNKVAAEFPGKTVAIVTHNVVVKGAVCVALQTPVESIYHVDIAPCSITTIKIWPSDGLIALMSMSEKPY